MEVKTFLKESRRKEKRKKGEECSIVRTYIRTYVRDFFSVHSCIQILKIIILYLLFIQSILFYFIYILLSFILLWLNALLNDTILNQW